MGLKHTILLERLFLDAVELPPEQRRAFVESACPDQPETREQLLLLLDADGPNLEGPLSLDRPAHAIQEQVPASIGSYRITGVIGQGGMGTVYQALQGNPRRRVALKVVRVGLATPRMIRRFEIEAAALAALHHPSIVQVFEAGYELATYPDGTATPRPFLSMELVEGSDIVTHAKAARMTTRAVLGLFCAVCEAVQHAHQRGVIHLDLKPANILVDAGGRPRIMDFGIARLLDRDQAGHTGPPVIAGSPPYSAPEQCRGDSEALSACSDVYSLGVILAELLTSQAPKSAGELPRHPALRGDLGDIARTAMADEPAERYQSVAELRADIVNVLQHRPIAARPARPIYRLRRFVLRNRLLVTAAAIVALALGAGAAIAAREAVRAQHAADDEANARAQAVQAAQEADAAVEFLTRTLEFADPSILGHDATVREVLDMAASTVGSSWKQSPLTEARVRMSLGAGYHALGDFGRAAEHLERAHGIRAEVLGREHDLTLDSALHLAAAVDNRGEHDRAAELAGSVYAVRQRTLGPASLRTREAAADLANIRIKQQKFAEAETLFKVALPVDVAAGTTPGDLDIQTSYASLLSRLGRYPESADLYAHAMPVLESRQGADDPSTLRCMVGYASTLRMLGRTGEAEILLRQAVETRTRVLGAQHPETLGSIHDLALLLMATGRTAEAEPMYQRVADSAAIALGPMHRNTLKARFNLAQCWVTMGQSDRAEPELRRVLEDQESALGKDNVDVADSLQTLGAVLAERHDDLHAAECYQRAVACLTRLGLQDSVTGAAIRSSCGAALTRTGSFAEAERELQAALAAQSAQGQQQRTDLTLQRLIALYELTSRPGDAARCRERLGSAK